MKTIFVFGSNREGRHGKGAALEARIKWGAVYGQAEGFHGHSYAIITKELRSHKPPVTLDEVRQGVCGFLDFAKDHQEYSFHVTEIGCGLAGFSHIDIAPMFLGATSNVNLPNDFKLILDHD